MTWLLGAVDGVDRRLYMDISMVTSANLLTLPEYSFYSVARYLTNLRRLNKNELN